MKYIVAAVLFVVLVVFVAWPLLVREYHMLWLDPEWCTDVIGADFGGCIDKEGNWLDYYEMGDR